VKAAAMAVQLHMEALQEDIRRALEPGLPEAHGSILKTGHRNYMASPTTKNGFEAQLECVQGNLGDAAVHLQGLADRMDLPKLASVSNAFPARLREETERHAPRVAQSKVEQEPQNKTQEVVGIFAMAYVTEVTEGSPAHLAQLQVGDIVLSFGDVVYPAKIKDIASIVSRSEGKEVRVCVLCKGAQLKLSVTPQIWAGQGLIGARLLPLHQFPASAFTDLESA